MQIEVWCKQGILRITGSEISLERHIAGREEQKTYRLSDVVGVESRMTALGSQESPDILHLSIKLAGGETLETSMVPRPDAEKIVAALHLGDLP